MPVKHQHSYWWLQVGKSDVDLGALDGDGFWPVQIAYFKPSTIEVEPEYEIQYWLQPNGVVRRYEHR